MKRNLILKLFETPLTPAMITITRIMVIVMISLKDYLIKLRCLGLP